ncbi:MAG: class I SAM-dependent methyltransferase [bacterium]
MKTIKRCYGKIFESHHTKTLLEKNHRFIRGKLLDLGCGRCKYKQLVLQNADSYTGCDYYDHKNMDIKCSADNTPFEDDSFDTIICFQVLEHVLDPQKVIEESFRILKKGGYMLLSTPWMHPYHGEPDDYYRFSKDALSYLLKKSGYEILEIVTTGGRWRVIECFSRRWCKSKFLYKILSKIFLLFNYFSKTEKCLDTPGHFIIAKK